MPGTATKDAAQQTPGLEHKSLGGGAGAGLLAADDVTGVVEAIVSVTGIEDKVKDTILPGAYTKTLLDRKPKGIMGHDWGRWVARTEEVKELRPGDQALPKTTPQGQPWPAHAGALYVKAQFNMATTEGRDAYNNVKFFGPECEWSIGYQVPRGGATRTADGGRQIKALDLYEYSPVLFGAAPMTGNLSVKSASGGGDGDGNDDMNDPVTAEADSGDPDIAALHEQAMAEMDKDPHGWDAIDAASAINPREEDLNSVGTSAADAAADQRRQGSGQPAKVILDGDVTLEFKDDSGDSTDGGKSSVKVSNTPWSNFTAADYDPAQYHRACLIHDHGPGVPDSKDKCKLPVREPNGKLNRNAVHAAAGALAGARGGVQASADQKAKVTKTLRGMYSTIGDMPPESLQAKVLTSAATAAAGPAGPSGPTQLRARLSAAKWTGDHADYTPQQWHSACLIHDHPDDGTIPDSKDQCKLPVADPAGDLHLEGMNAAAGKLPVEGASDQQNADAGGALRSLFMLIGVLPPDGLQTKVAGQEVTPKDVAATDRLKAWYTHGGGAAEINWGVPGDFMRCVTIAGKHMDPAKARGFCQLRHHDATGAYAGHAPGEEAAHAAAGAAAGKKDAAGGYDPALETGPMAGTASPWDAAGLQTKDDDGGQVLELPGSLEETVDAVTDAVTGVLGGAEHLPGGLPRHLVTVNGTWPGHVIATRFDMSGADAGEGDAFQVPYTWGEDGAVQLGDPQPVTLTVTDDSGTKAVEQTLAGLPVLVEHVTGVIRRGLQVKAGRVLSEVNAKLLRSAVDQLVSVMRSAGIPIDIPGNDTPDSQEEAANSAGIDPLYLPDSTAPGAQVQGKSLLDPSLRARALRVTAEAYSRGGDDDA